MSTISGSLVTSNNLNLGNIENSKIVKSITIPDSIVIQGNIVYLDHSNPKSLEELKGKYIYRVHPKVNSINFLGADTTYDDTSFTDRCIKIISISSIGEIVYEDPCYRETSCRRVLVGEWNDRKWRVVTPEIYGLGFLENMCSVIGFPKLKQETLALVDQISSVLDGDKDDCHLSSDDIFYSLRDFCALHWKRERLLPLVDKLQELLGSLSVVIV